MVINLNEYKLKKSKAFEASLNPHRQPLYVSHNTGKVTGDNFGKKLDRVRESLEKIDNLMAELKELETYQNEKRS